MYCRKCGTQLTDDSRFCYKCGTPTHLAEQKDSIAEKDDYDPFEPLVQPANNPEPQTQTPPTQQQSPAPTAADEGVFGIVGFVLAFFFPILGLIFSIIGMSKKKYNNLATAGFVLSILFIIIYIIVIVVVVENTHTTYPFYYYYND